MLTIVVPSSDAWDERTEKFVKFEGATLNLHHSLVSLSKWESRFKKPFLSNDDKTIEETYGYIQAMSDVHIPEEVLPMLTQANLKEVNTYIEDPHSATWFAEVPGARKSREIITSEVIYYWLTALQLSMECQNWHLNRLFTLIRVTNEKNQPKKKMGKAEAMAQQRKLNAERLAKMQTTG